MMIDIEGKIVTKDKVNIKGVIPTSYKNYELVCIASNCKDPKLKLKMIVYEKPQNKKRQKTAFHEFRETMQ